MNSLYYYSILQYRYAQSLGEVLNIGVLLLFPDQRQATFLYPERLTRIRKLYPKFAERTVRAYFKGIEFRTRQLSKQPEIFANYEEHPRQLIDSEILIRDSSALQFSELKAGVQYTDDIAVIGEHFYKLYLSFYDEVDATKGRHDDTYLLKSYKKKIRQYLGDRFSREVLERPIVVKPESSDIAYRFDFAWQNGTYNLVKPVSFDLKLEHSISDKATLNYGQFAILQPYAERNNARFDVLVARPKERQLFKSYDDAIRLLEEQPRVNVIEESELENYSEKTADALK